MIVVACVENDSFPGRFDGMPVFDESRFHALTCKPGTGFPAASLTERVNENESFVIMEVEFSLHVNDNMEEIKINMR